MERTLLTIRQACVEDLPALTALRYYEHPAIHRDRIHAFDPHRLHYVIAAYDQQIVGFGVLLLEQPPDWSEPVHAFPLLIDLFVGEPYRSRGIGQALIQHMEGLAQQYGKSAISLSVEPHANPRAHQLYARLGYIPLQEQPYHNRWRFTDSDGRLHEGEEWLIDMQKKLD
jgi:GNAT superfamily N-acetyltransferase